MDHRKPTIITLIALLLTAAFWLVACETQPIVAPINQSRIQVINSDEELTYRVTYFEDRNLQLYKSSAPGDPEQIAANEGVQLKLRAQVTPPGPDLQAGHVTLGGGFAFVSYSAVNDAYHGAVELYNIEDPRRPSLVSTAIFADSDVRVAVPSREKLYLGEATDSDHDPNFDSPACLEVMEWSAAGLAGARPRIDLPSYSANDITVIDGSIFVTTGTTGGTLSIVDATSFQISAQIPIEGAKAVTHGAHHLLVLEGTGRRLHVYDRLTRTWQRTVDLGCENYFQAKAEMEIADGKVYLSAWECGMKVVDVNTGLVEDSIPAPEGGACNAVSIAGELLFMANGEKGLLVARITRSGLRVLGSAEFAGSVNFVAADGNQLFVAIGRGGLAHIEIVKQS